MESKIGSKTRDLDVSVAFTGHDYYETFWLSSSTRRRAKSRELELESYLKLDGFEERNCCYAKRERVNASLVGLK